MRHWKSSIGDVLPPRLAVPLRVRFGRSREPEVELVKHFLKRGGTAVDVGAHLGIYTYAMAEAVGSQGSVYGFEPQPQLSDYLSRAFIHRESVHIRCAAVAETSGHTTLRIPIDHGQYATGGASIAPHRQFDQFAAMRVETVTLDSAITGRIDLVKIDTEGAELGVLRGAVGHLRNNAPVLVIEIDARMAGDDAVLASASLLMQNHGYQCFRLMNDRLVAIQIDHVLVEAQSHSGTNFIFLHPQDPTTLARVWTAGFKVVGLMP